MAEKNFPEASPRPKPDALTLLKIPLAVDSAMVLSIVVGGTIVWQEQQQIMERQRVMSEQIVQIQNAIEAGRTTEFEDRATSADRLARIEERIIIVQEQVADLKKEIRGR